MGELGEIGGEEREREREREGVAGKGGRGVQAPRVERANTCGGEGRGGPPSRGAQRTLQASRGCALLSCVLVRGRGAAPSCSGNPHRHSPSTWPWGPKLAGEHGETWATTVQ